VRYKAVVFDLFGTLVDSPSFVEVRDMLVRMARASGVPEEFFLRAWMGETRVARSRGQFPDIETCLAHICRLAGVPVEEHRIKEAVSIRLEFTKNALTPRPDALSTLVGLKELGLRCGLLSDCSPDVPLLWPQTPFASIIDAAVFSCTAGMTKPDPRIYHLVCDRLRVRPEQCLYVGDGDSQELTGARAVGMDALMIRVPYDQGHRTREDDWKGPRIDSLSTVLSLISEAG